MAHYSALVLLLLPYLAFSFIFIASEGPCPAPPGVQVTPDKIKGKWYGIASTFEEYRDHYEGEKCYEVTADFKDNGIEVEATYKGNTPGETRVSYKRYTPIENQPGRYHTYNRNTNGEWESDDSVYTLIATEGDAILGYSCKEYSNGLKHFNVYRILSTDVSISQEEVEKLKSVAKDNGNSYNFVNLKQNC